MHETADAANRHPGAEPPVSRGCAHRAAQRSGWMIANIELGDVTSMFAMEEIKSTTRLPPGDLL